MTFSLRAVTVPDDYPRIAEILTLTTDTPSTVERLAASDANLPASTIRQRLVAVSPDRVIAAYGAATHGAFQLPGRFHVRVFTHPAFRRQGAGSLLWDALVGWVRQRGAVSLATSAQDHDAESIAFIEQRGFTRVRHIFESQVDLPEHDGSASSRWPSSPGKRPSGRSMPWICWWPGITPAMRSGSFRHLRSGGR